MCIKPASLISPQRRVNRYFKSVAATLILCLLFQDFSYANPEELKVREAVAWIANRAPNSFQFPASVATVEDRFMVPGQKTVYLIQDPHTNFSGQKNIARALEFLSERENISGAFVEAGFGDASLTFLKTADAKARNETGLRYLQRGEMSGPEFLSLTAGKPFYLWGVEDESLYWQSLEVYRRIFARREKFQDYLHKIESTAEILKPRVFNPLLSAFDQKHEDFLREKISPTEYVSLLLNQAEMLGLNLSRYPHAKMFRSLGKKENEIDFALAAREQQAAVGALPALDRQEIISAMADFKNIGQQKQIALLEWLKEKIGSFASYPHLEQYFQYLKKSRGLSASRLVEEQKRLESDVYAALLQTEEEKTLHKISQALRNLKSLLDLTMTPDEFHAYEENPRDFDITRITGFLNRILMSLDTRYDKALFLERGHEETLRDCEAFYRLTRERDEVFVNKTLEAMEKQNLPKAALVTGGYHSPNLKKILKQKNISYVCVTPQILSATNHERYEELLLGQSVSKNAEPVLRVWPEQNHMALVEIANRPETGKLLSAARLAQEMGVKFPTLDGARLASTPLNPPPDYDRYTRTLENILKIIRTDRDAKKSFRLGHPLSLLIKNAVWETYYFYNKYLSLDELGIAEGTSGIFETIVDRYWPLIMDMDGYLSYLDTQLGRPLPKPLKKICSILDPQGNVHVLWFREHTAKEDRVIFWSQFSFPLNLILSERVSVAMCAFLRDQKMRSRHLVVLRETGETPFEFLQILVHEYLHARQTPRARSLMSVSPFHRALMEGFQIYKEYDDLRLLAFRQDETGEYVRGVIMEHYETLFSKKEKSWRRALNTIFKRQKTSFAYVPEKRLVREILKRYPDKKYFYILSQEGNPAALKKGMGLSYEPLRNFITHFNIYPQSGGAISCQFSRLRTDLAVDLILKKEGKNLNAGRLKRLAKVISGVFAERDNFAPDAIVHLAERFGYDQFYPRLLLISQAYLDGRVRAPETRKAVRQLLMHHINGIGLTGLGRFGIEESGARLAREMSIKVDHSYLLAPEKDLSRLPLDKTQHPLSIYGSDKSRPMDTMEKYFFWEDPVFQKAFAEFTSPSEMEQTLDGIVEHVHQWMVRFVGRDASAVGMLWPRVCFRASTMALSGFFFLRTELKKLGNPRIEGSIYTGENDFSHVFIRIFSGNNVMIYDPTVTQFKDWDKLPGIRKAPAGSRLAAITDAEWSRNLQEWIDGNYSGDLSAAIENPETPLATRKIRAAQYLEMIQKLDDPIKRVAQGAAITAAVHTLGRDRARKIFPEMRDPLVIDGKWHAALNPFLFENVSEHLDAASAIFDQVDSSMSSALPSVSTDFGYEAQFHTAYFLENSKSKLINVRFMLGSINEDHADDLLRELDQLIGLLSERIRRVERSDSANKERALQKLSSARNYLSLALREANFDLERMKLSGVSPGVNAYISEAREAIDTSFEIYQSSGISYSQKLADLFISLPSLSARLLTASAASPAKKSEIGEDVKSDLMDAAILMEKEIYALSLPNQSSDQARLVATLKTTKASLEDALVKIRIALYLHDHPINGARLAFEPQALTKKIPVSSWREFEETINSWARRFEGINFFDFPGADEPVVLEEYGLKYSHVLGRELHRRFSSLFSVEFSFNLQILEEEDPSGVARRSLIVSPISQHNPGSLSEETVSRAYLLVPETEEPWVLSRTTDSFFQGLWKYSRRFISGVQNSRAPVPIKMQSDKTAADSVLAQAKWDQRRARHEGILKDEEGIYWIVKKRQPGSVEDAVSRAEKNVGRRERLAWLVSRGRANLAEIRVPLAKEYPAGFIQGNSQDYYLTRIVNFGNVRAYSLPHFSFGPAFAAALVSHVMLRYAPHTSNTAYSHDVPVAIDHDRILGPEFMERDAGFSRFLFSYMRHAVFLTFKRLVKGYGPRSLWALIRIQVAEWTAPWNLPVALAQAEKIIADYGLGAAWVAAEGLTVENIRQSILEFKKIKNFRQLAAEAGFEGAELDRVSAQLTATQASLGTDTEKLWQVMTGAKGGFESLDGARLSSNKSEKLILRRQEARLTDYIHEAYRYFGSSREAGMILGIGRSTAHRHNKGFRDSGKVFPARAFWVTLAQMKRAYFIAILIAYQEETQAQIAQEMGIGLRTFTYQLREYGLDMKEFRVTPLNELVTKYIREIRIALSAEEAQGLIEYYPELNDNSSLKDLAAASSPKEIAVLEPSENEEETPADLKKIDADGYEWEGQWYNRWKTHRATIEKKLIIQAMKAAKGNETQASAMLGSSRSNLLRKMALYSLNESSFALQSSDDLSATGGMAEKINLRIVLAGEFARVVKKLYLVTGSSFDSVGKQMGVDRRKVSNAVRELGIKAEPMKEPVRVTGTVNMVLPTWRERKEKYPQSVSAAVRPDTALSFNRLKRAYLITSLIVHQQKRLAQVAELMGLPKRIFYRWITVFKINLEEMKNIPAIELMFKYHKEIGLVLGEQEAASLARAYGMTADDLRAIDIEKVQLDKLSGTPTELFAEKTREFQRRLQRGEDLRGVRPEAFALFKRAASEAIGEKPYHQQVLAAISICEGRAVEMEPGEGKTLAIAMAAYLGALTGKGAHVHTFNDSLAARDAKKMGKIFKLLGLTVGLRAGTEESFVHGADGDWIPGSKQEAYQCDITYGMASRFVFDFLEDQMKMSLGEKSQRLNAPALVVVDEADGILFDEASLPLILVGFRAGTFSAIDYQKIYDFACNLIEGKDYRAIYQEKKIIIEQNVIDAWEQGLLNTAQIPRRNFKKFREEDNFGNLLRQALSVRHFHKKGRDYVIQNRRIVLVNEFTGRLQPEHILANHRHNFIVAREKALTFPSVSIQELITFQNYYRAVKKQSIFSAISGTMGSPAEVREIYGLDFTRIDPRFKSMLASHPEKIFMTREEKLENILKDIVSIHDQGRGRPIIVYFREIGEADDFAERVRQKTDIIPNVLHALNIDNEEEIIRLAGKKGSVIITTNVIGRGSDIVPEDLRGPVVISTERNLQSRIDRQQMLRTARHGRHGEYRLYTSVLDEVPDLFGTQKKSEERLKENNALNLFYDDAIDKNRTFFHRVRDRILELYAYEPDPSRPGISKILEKVDKAYREYLNGIDSLKYKENPETYLPASETLFAGRVIPTLKQAFDLMKREFDFQEMLKSEYSAPAARLAQNQPVYHFLDLLKEGYTPWIEEKIYGGGRSSMIVQLRGYHPDSLFPDLKMDIDGHQNFIYVDSFYADFPKPGEGEPRFGRGRALLRYVFDPARYGGYEIAATASPSFQKSWASPEMKDFSASTKIFDPGFTDKIKNRSDARSLAGESAIVHKLDISTLHGVVPAVTDLKRGTKPERVFSGSFKAVDDFILSLKNQNEKSPILEKTAELIEEAARQPGSYFENHSFHVVIDDCRADGFVKARFEISRNPEEFSPWDKIKTELVFYRPAGEEAAETASAYQKSPHVLKASAGARLTDGPKNYTEVFFIGKVVREQKPAAPGEIAIGGRVFSFRASAENVEIENEDGVRVQMSFASLESASRRRAGQKTGLRLRDEIEISLSDFQTLFSTALKRSVEMGKDDVLASLESVPAAIPVNLDELNPRSSTFSTLTLPLLLGALQKMRARSEGKNTAFVLRSADPDLLSRVMNFIYAADGSLREYVFDHIQKLPSEYQNHVCSVTGQKTAARTQGLRVYMEDVTEGAAPDFLFYFQSARYLAAAGEKEISAENPILGRVFDALERRQSRAGRTRQLFSAVTLGQTTGQQIISQYFFPMAARLSPALALQAARLATRMLLQSA